MVDRMTDDYATNSQIQQAAQSTMMPRFIECIETYLLDNKAKLKDKGVVSVVDLGCADGKNDLDILRQIIGMVRDIVGKECEVVIYMNDIPQTNASTIITNVTSEIKDKQNVHFYAKPSSFYE